MALAIFQVLSGHMWLVATMLDREDTEYSIMTEISIGHQSYKLDAFTIERILCGILIIEKLRRKTGPDRYPGTEDRQKPRLPLEQQGGGGVSSTPGPGGLAGLSPKMKPWSIHGDCWKWY